MSATKNVIFSSLKQPEVEIDSTYDTSTAIEIGVPGMLHGTPPFVYKKAVFEGITIYVSEIVTAASLTVRICFDPDGDSAVLPETTANIVTGISAATAGSVCISGSRFASLYPYPFGTLYVFIKTNAGTCTVNTVTASFRGE